MRGFRVLLGKELLEQWRTMRLPSALAVFTFVGISSPALARYMPQFLAAVGGSQFSKLIPNPTIADAYQQLAKNAGQFGALLGIILAMGVVSAERDRGTLAFLLSKPVTRPALLLAKASALAATMVAGVALAAALAYAYTAMLFSPPPAAFAVFALLVALALLVFTSLTLAASTLTRSTVAAGGIGFGLLVLLGALSAVPRAGEYTPASLMARAASAVGSGDFSSLVGPALAQAGLVAAGLVAAVVALRRQEI